MNVCRICKEKGTEKNPIIDIIGMCEYCYYVKCK